jgi:2-methylisocitrate lyase-like PEP mutase family enzyme
VTPTAPFRFRQLLKNKPLVVAPGAYDGLGARLIEQSGFDVVYMGGAITSSTYGLPDYGLTTMTEIAENAGRLAAAVEIPLIADADTGYGNELNVTRTVREFERRGVAGIHLEDQVTQKRCGHLEGKVVVPRAEFVSRIRAAVAARRDPDFLLIARSDALAPHGFDEAVWRVNAALDAGADMAFIDAPQSIEQVAAIPKLVKGPCMLNIVSGGKTPDVDLKTAEHMGYRFAILSSMLIFGALMAFEAALRSVRETGRPPSIDSTPTLAELFRRLGSDDWDKVRSDAAARY